MSSTGLDIITPISCEIGNFLSVHKSPCDVVWNLLQFNYVFLKEYATKAYPFNYTLIYSNSSMAIGSNNLFLHTVKKLSDFHIYKQRTFKQFCKLLYFSYMSRRLYKTTRPLLPI